MKKIISILKNKRILIPIVLIVVAVIAILSAMAVVRVYVSKPPVSHQIVSISDLSPNDVTYLDCNDFLEIDTSTIKGGIYLWIVDTGDGLAITIDTMNAEYIIVNNYSIKKLYVNCGEYNDVVINDSGENIEEICKFYLRGGDDYFKGAYSNAIEVVYGGAGKDTITGIHGCNYLYGEDGNDTIKGGDGDNILRGGNGDDIILCNYDYERMIGHTNEAYGDNGNDFILGNYGTDVIYGGPGDDKINGNQGDDRLYGGDGYDYIHGGYGNDIITGGAGNDYLFGEIGDDTIRGGEGYDYLYGGCDYDLLIDSRAGNSFDDVDGLNIREK